MEGDLLEHPRRKTLYDTIINSPGITFSELKKILDWSEGTLQYHLRQLQRKEMIRKEVQKGKRTYFSFERKTEIIDDERKRIRKLNQKQSRLLAIIQDHPNMNQKELSTISRLNRFLLSYNLKELIKQGLISTRRDGRYIRYSVVDQDEMKGRLLIKLVDELLDGRIDEETYRRLKRKLE